MAKEYLDKTGLNALWSLIKTAINQLVEDTANHLNKGGDTMEGDINMNDNDITNVDDLYVYAIRAEDGYDSIDIHNKLVMNSANIDMDANNIINCGTISADGDGVIFDDGIDTSENGFYVNGEQGTDEQLVQGDGKFRTIQTDRDDGSDLHDDEIPTGKIIEGHVNEKINEISVGGRNLACIFSNISFENGFRNDDYSLEQDSTDNDRSYLIFSITDGSGDVYVSLPTLSTTGLYTWKLKATSGGVSKIIFKNESVDTDDHSDTTFTFTLTQEIKAYEDFCISAYFLYTSSYMRVKWVKIEKGNKPTGWTFAPEDIDYMLQQRAAKTHTHALTDIIASSATRRNLFRYFDYLTDMSKYTHYNVSSATSDQTAMSITINGKGMSYLSTYMKSGLAHVMRLVEGKKYYLTFKVTFDNYLTSSSTGIVVYDYFTIQPYVFFGTSATDANTTNVNTQKNIVSSTPTVNFTFLFTVPSGRPFVTIRFGTRATYNNVYKTFTVSEIGIIPLEESWRPSIEDVVYSYTNKVRIV